ncbi:condensin complex subunit 2/barren [Dipodascopsis tothii]|uniref:condensin complex subunit 2/barren n=1 Tax=Dipodascopsis tothii TaxID=44089 RepID=UPI0034D02165
MASPGYSPSPKKSARLRQNKPARPPPSALAFATAALNDDASEKEARSSKRRSALHELNKNIIASASSTPRGRSATDELDADSLELSSRSAGRVPILANFEEWMKMATDNKINANNSWNFALIDYFHDMSLLKDGDGINFQKASCTLDGCVKIYSSRIDSVATETGNLLSGLAESNKKPQAAAAADGSDTDEDDDDAQKKKPKRRVRSEATLAKDFAAIQIKKLDLEFAVDPLFKKTSADFDEGGARGLLLNHLHVKETGQIVFDTSEKADSADTADDDGRVRTREVDLSSLRECFLANLLPGLDDKFISPSLKGFNLLSSEPNSTLELPFLHSAAHSADNSFAHEQSVVMDDAPADVEHFAPPDEFAPPLDDDDDCGVGGFGADDATDATIRVKEEFGNGGDAWISARPDAAAAPAADDTVADDEPADDPAEYALEPAVAKPPDSAESVFAYFDESLKRNWAGPQHWKIERIKKDTKLAEPELDRAAPPKEKKAALVINFLDPDDDVDEDVLFDAGTTSANTLMPKSQWHSKTRNLLPDDKQFSSRQLLRLFLKPRAKFAGFAASGAGVIHGARDVRDDARDPDMDEHYWAERYRQEPAAEPAGNYDANFFDDNGADDGPGFFADDDGDAFEDAHADLPASQVPEGGIMSAIFGKDGDSQQLLSSLRTRSGTDYVNYARVAKRVDVKKLKDNIWDKLEYHDDAKDATAMDISVRDASPPADDEPKLFSDVVSNLKDAYAPQALASISTSFCFICLLHLANEKGLNIENNPDLTDLVIRRDHTAVIDQY